MTKAGYRSEAEAAAYHAYWLADRADRYDSVVRARLAASAEVSGRDYVQALQGYWVARAFWGRGIASEACAAVIDIARALGLRQLEASHFIDNPASARVLDKLGFESTGIIAPRMSCARGEEVPARLMRLRLAEVEEKRPAIAA